MKITLIHGEDTTTSRDRFKKIIQTVRSRGWEVAGISPGKLSLQEQLTTNSLFSKESLFVIDNLKKFGKKDLEWISKSHHFYDGNLLSWHEGDIPAASLRTWPKGVRFEKFDLPQELFIFLEALYPGNSNASLKLFHSLLARQHEQFIFTMMARHFRDLYWVSRDKGSMEIPTWRAEKLARQAQKFESGQIKKIINLLAACDVATKTSRQSLTRSLDLVISSQLK